MSRLLNTCSLEYILPSQVFFGKLALGAGTKLRERLTLTQPQAVQLELSAVKFNEVLSNVEVYK